MREAARDEVLPLSTLLVTKSGKTITEIPIPKDMILVISTAGYNRFAQPSINRKHQTLIDMLGAETPVCLGRMRNYSTQSAGLTARCSRPPT
jgi:hypothetical protein